VTDLETSDKTLYRERVLPNFGTFAATFVFLPSAVVVSEPFDVRVGFVIGVIGVSIIWSLLILKAPRIHVSRTDLTVNQVSVPLSLIGDPIEISKKQIFDERGPGLELSAHKVFQGTVKTALRIPILDPQDQTPYWLISSRHPGKFAQALKKPRNHTLNK
jgi:hypothetical protein